MINLMKMTDKISRGTEAQEVSNALYKLTRVWYKRILCREFCIWFFVCVEI